MRSSLLLALLFALAVGLFSPTVLVLVRHQQGQRRAEALRERVPEAEDRAALVHLVVRPGTASARFSRVGRHEVRFEGHLYDVAFEERRGDTLHVWVRWDREEEEAVARLEQGFGEAPGTGLAAPSPRLADPHPLYVLPAPVAPSAPPARSLRRASPRAAVGGAPVDDVPHPPPWG